MPEVWEKLPEESHKAFQAFSSLLDQWPDISFVEGYKAISGKTDARQMPGTWYLWKGKFQWDERLAAYDKWRREEDSKAKAEAHKEDYNRKLEEYRKAHETLARGSFNVMLAGVKALEEYVIKYTGDPRKGIEPTQKIKTTDEAAKISRIISDFMRQAPAVWEAALGIPELKDQLEAMNEPEE